MDEKRRSVLKSLGAAGVVLSVGGVGAASARNGRRQGASGDQTIVDVAEANDETFSILLAALEETGLDEVLDSKGGQYTVFAPTNEAFGDLLELLDATAEELLARGDLETILLYHLTRGRRYAASLDDDEDVRMLNGGFTTVGVDGDDIFLNDSKVVAPFNVEASNGVVHTIDTVLLP